MKFNEPRELQIKNKYKYFFLIILYFTTYDNNKGLLQKYLKITSGIIKNKMIALFIN